MFQLATTNVAMCTSKVDKLAALVAAAVHDVGHTGQGNGYHVAAGTDLALMYRYAMTFGTVFV